MAVTLNAYLHFNDSAEEALNFYKSVFGGELEISRFSDIPNMPVPTEQQQLVMHAVLKGDTVEFMASDALPMGGVKGGDSISLALSGDDVATLTKYFEALGDGGSITDPLSDKPWGATFGMVIDKFGVHWMVNITQPQA